MDEGFRRQVRDLAGRRDEWPESVVVFRPRRSIVDAHSSRYATSRADLARDLALDGHVVEAGVCRLRAVGRDEVLVYVYPDGDTVVRPGFYAVRVTP